MPNIAIAPIIISFAMLCGISCGNDDAVRAISVKEALESRPGQYQNLVTIEAEVVRLYGLALRDRNCASPCHNVISLVVPETMEGREDIAPLLLAVNKTWKKKAGVVQAVVIVKLTYGRRPLNSAHTRYGWGVGRVELVKVLDFKVVP